MNRAIRNEMVEKVGVCNYETIQHHQIDVQNTTHLINSKKTKIELTPRKYQETQIEKISKAHTLQKSRIVLAAATGSGKTEMAIMITDNFLSLNKGRVLVVAHHTNVIKDNFYQRLQEINPEFTYSTTDTDVDVFVTIRQNVTKLNMSDYGLVVVDEAHHNYFSQTLKILKDVNHQLLLTATPSKFVARGGYDIIPVGRLDIPNKWFAKLNFRLINCDNEITKDDLNKFGDLYKAYTIKNTDMYNIISSVVPHLGEEKKLFVLRQTN